MLAAATALLAVTGCIGGEGAVEAEGDTIAASATAVVQGERVRVLLPAGALDLVVAEPRSSVPANQTASGRTTEAREGDRVLGVSWRLLPVFADNGANFGTPGAYYDDAQASLVQRLRVRLRVGEETREIPVVTTSGEAGSPVRPAGTAWLVVPEVAVDDAVVEVEYDGLTQVVEVATARLREAGHAPLLPYPLPERATCENGTSAEAERLDLRVSATCQVDTLLLPYVEGLGWAEDGQVWALADLSTYGMVSGLPDDVAVEVERVDGELVAGERRAAQVPGTIPNGEDARWASEVAVEVPLGRRTVLEGSAVYRLEGAGAPSSGALVEAPFSFEVDASALAAPGGESR